MVSFLSKIALIRICQDDVFLFCKCCPNLLITVKCALQNYNKCKTHQEYIGVYYDSPSILKIDLVMFNQFSLAFVLQFIIIFFYFYFMINLCKLCFL